MIIGISGKIGSGKDTIGKIIQLLVIWYEDLNFDQQASFRKHYIDEKDFVLRNFNSSFINDKYRIKKFADKIKDIVCLLIGCTREQLEDQNFKNTELEKSWNKVYYKIAEDKTQFDEGEPSIQLEEKLTPRKILQLLGTDCGRNIIHPNIWVNSLFSDYSNILGEYPNWIITDLRFPNELEAIKKRNGITIRVNRKIKCYCGHTITCDCNSKNEHESEKALDDAQFDYIIDNNGTIEELIEKVKEILTKEGII